MRPHNSPAVSAGLQLKIFSPFETYYDGPAVSISATNATGPFDILVGHAKFFSVLEGGAVNIDTGSGIKEFTVDRGIIRVADNSVTLFANV